METGGSSKKTKKGSRKIIVKKGMVKIFSSTASKKKERVRLMLDLELLCISSALARVTCLVTSTKRKSSRKISKYLGERLKANLLCALHHGYL